MGSLNFFKVTCVKKSASADEKEHEVNGAAEQRRNWQENRHYEVAAHRRPRVLLERVKGERRRRRQGERNIYIEFILFKILSCTGEAVGLPTCEIDSAFRAF